LPLVSRSQVSVVTPASRSAALRTLPFSVAGSSDMNRTKRGRTVGTDQAVDELVMSFTRDVTMGALLPGVPLTGRPVRLALCVVAGFRDGKLTHEHIYWDQASLLVQVGLLDPAGLPVVGVRQADKLLAPRSLPANTLLGDSWAPDG
jgi:carboxymethylenebutenolidase